MSDNKLFDYVTDEDWDDPTPFRCPRCDGEWTHLDHVVMVTENGGMRLHGGGEDESAIVTATVAETERVGRRHAIIIEGECETCPATFRLVFRQHKGNTFLTTTQADRQRLEWEGGSDDY